MTMLILALVIAALVVLAILRYSALVDRHGTVHYPLDSRVGKLIPIKMHALLKNRPARNHDIYDVSLQPSHRTILQDAFPADARHPIRRLLLEIGMIALPVVVLMPVIGVFLLLRAS